MRTTPLTRAGLVLAFLLTLEACGGATADVVARDTVVALGRGVVVVETGIATAQTQERERIRAERPSQEEGRQRLLPYWRAGDALFAVRSVLLAAATAIDAYGADGLHELAGCVIEALGRLREALTVLAELGGVAVPWSGELDSVLRVLSAYAGPCPTVRGDAS